MLKAGIGGCPRVLQILIWVLALPVTGVAQRDIRHTTQQWVQVYTQYLLTNGWSVLLDAGIRQTQQMALPSQRLIRAGIGYALPGKLTGVTGVARFSFQDEGRTFRREWRLWQEFNRTHALKHGSLQQRLRAEARFFEELSDIGADPVHHFNMRFRYRLQAQVPIASIKLGDENVSRLLVTVADELLINAGRGIVYNTFDNNRFVLGPALQCNPELTVSLLYNHQFGHRSQPNTAESTEIIWLTINWKGRWQ